MINYSFNYKTHLNQRELKKRKVIVKRNYGDDPNMTQALSTSHLESTGYFGYFTSV